MLSFIPVPCSLATRAWIITFALLAGSSLFAQRPTSPPPRPDDESRMDNLSERLSETVANTVDTTAAWLDSRFGPSSAAYREKSHGYIRVVPLWVDHHGWDWETRFRARIDLPNIDRRLHAVFGAGDSDNFIAERPLLAELEELAIAKERFGDRSFLAGLGYSLRERDTSSFRISGGLRFDFPIEPYVRARYTHVFPLDSDLVIRAHQSFYARTQRGQGSITGVDIEKALSPVWLARSSAYAHYSTWDERPEEYAAEFSIARALQNQRLIALMTFAYVEPRADVSLRDYGARLIYRWHLSRNRLYAEIHTGVTWPRYTLEEERRPSLNLGFGLELHFGDRRMH